MSSLEFILSKLNQTIEFIIPNFQELQPEESELFKRNYYEAFRMLINHQYSRNTPAFIDYLIKIQQPKEDYYQTFQRILAPQAHIGSDLFEKSQAEPSQYIEKKDLLVPDDLRNRVNRGLSLGLIQYPKDVKVKHDLIQYFPVFPFRLDYMKSIIFIISDKIEQLRNIVVSLGFEDIIDQEFQTPQTQTVSTAPEVVDIKAKQEQIELLLVRPQPIEKRFELQEETVYHHRARQALFTQFAQYLLKCLFKYQKNIVRKSFKTLRRVEKFGMSKVQRLFLQKKIFEILRARINNCIYRKFYCNKLRMFAYLALSNYASARKNKRNKLQNIGKILQIDYYRNALEFFDRLKTKYEEYLVTKRIQSKLSNIQNQSQSTIRVKVEDHLDNFSNQNSISIGVKKKGTKLQEQKSPYIDKTPKKQPKHKHKFGPTNICSVCSYKM